MRFGSNTGRTVISALIVVYLTAGPISNISANLNESVRVILCQMGLTFSLLKTKYELMFKPLSEALLKMKVSPRYFTIPWIHERYFKKILCWTFDDLDFPVKTIKFHVKISRFSSKNHKIAGKVFNFFRKILRFFKENLPIYTGKFNDFYKKMRQFL